MMKACFAKNMKVFTLYLCRSYYLRLPTLDVVALFFMLNSISCNLIIK